MGIAHQQLRFRPAQRGSQTHSGLRVPPVLATLATAVIDSYAFGLAQRKPLGFTLAYAAYA